MSLDGWMTLPDLLEKYRDKAKYSPQSHALSLDRVEEQVKKLEGEEGAVFFWVSNAIPSSTNENAHDICISVESVAARKIDGQWVFRDDKNLVQSIIAKKKGITIDQYRKEIEARKEQSKFPCPVCGKPAHPTKRYYRGPKRDQKILMFGPCGCIVNQDDLEISEGEFGPVWRKKGGTKG